MSSLPEASYCCGLKEPSPGRARLFRYSILPSERPVPACCLPLSVAQLAKALCTLLSPKVLPTAL